MRLRIWRFSTIDLVALLQGLSFAHVLERPAKMQYEAAMYAAVKHRAGEDHLAAARGEPVAGRRAASAWRPRAPSTACT
jgi:hypothetical protein